jgi:hypothetical protein
MPLGNKHAELARPGDCRFGAVGGRLVRVQSHPCSLTVTFLERLTAQDYAQAVLACQFALTLVGLDDRATVWPDGTTDDQQISELCDQWAETNPWSG